MLGVALDMVRSMVTPTMRCSTSVTERSGRAPMSDATIESTISSELCLIFWADCSAARLPLTTTVSIFSASLGPVPSAPKSAPQQRQLAWRRWKRRSSGISSDVSWLEWNGAESRGSRARAPVGLGLARQKGGDGADVPLHQVNPRQAEGWLAEVALS